MKNRIFKKLTALSLTAVTAVSLLAGCQSAESGSKSAEAKGGEAQKTEAAEETAAGEPETITMWGWNAGDIETIFNAYKEKTGANVTLDYVTVQQEESFQKLQTTISAGLELPDIVPSEVNQRGTMLALDIWEDLSAEPYLFDTNQIFAYQVPLCSNEKGELNAIPWDVSTAGLAYKRDLAKEYLGTDDPDEIAAMFPTWEAFLEKGVEIKEKSGDKVYMFASLTNVKQIMDGQNPLPIVQNDTLDMTSVKETLDWMIKFRDAGIVDNILESSTAYSASYADDLHIFYPCAGWTPNYVIRPNDPEGEGNWGLTIPPQGCFSWGGSAFMIPRDAEHKQAAYDFVKWMSTEEGTRTQREIVNYNTSNVDAYKDPEFAALYDDWFGGQNIGDLLFNKAMENIQVRAVSTHDATIMEVWSMVTEAVNSDSGIDLDGACRMFEEEMNALAPELKK
ncbi:MAG: extracellular solute-binding protein [Lachnospiraceae bacterium]